MHPSTLKPAAIRYLRVLNDYSIALAMARAAPGERFTARALDAAALAAALETLAMRTRIKRCTPAPRCTPDGFSFTVRADDEPGATGRRIFDRDTAEILPGEKPRADVELRGVQSEPRSACIEPDRPWPRIVAKIKRAAGPDPT